MGETDIDSSFFVFLSDLANLVNIAAIKAAVEGADKLNASQLEFAKDRIIMGTERKSMFISDESKKASCCFLRHTRTNSSSIHVVIFESEKTVNVSTNCFFSGSLAYCLP
jgi:hypothetical protein